MGGTNLALASDAMCLLSRLDSDGVLQKARAGLVPYGSRDFRVYTGLYALADTLLQQALPGDELAFDLYDALRLAWPEKQVPATDEFKAMHDAWRTHTPYMAKAETECVDLAMHRRVKQFMEGCA
ncbi:hypothetical protein RQP54_18510 [Curvibacter sp. APW13]|uniref:hypothetical protein n=1 Tax=Curvibacter sp. APW13 TaxID=3077236 RepID=UPI0028DF790F|nr:hypothetical protein [Curvibacter sp. APW13]MDT8992873.1 hypothetical protein [Curvibacter sp. APW13]